MSYTREAIEASVATFERCHSFNAAAMLRQLLAECDAAVAAKDKAEAEVERINNSMSWSEAKAHEDNAALRAELARVRGDTEILAHFFLREQLTTGNDVGKEYQATAAAQRILQATAQPAPVTKPSTPQSMEEYLALSMEKMRKLMKAHPAPTKETTK